MVEKNKKDTSDQPQKRTRKDPDHEGPEQESGPAANEPLSDANATPEAEDEQ